MKICFVHEEYPQETNFGGIATYQKLMAEYYANNGDSVIVITRGICDKDYFENNVHVYRVGGDNDNNSISSVKKYRKKVAELLLKLQNKNEIDIIETPDWGANTVCFEKYRKVPLIVRLHTPLKIWLKYNNNDFGEAKDMILKWENMMLENANMLISCSNLLKNNIEREYKINKNIFVLPNPSNNRDFYDNISYENKDIIFVGSLEERKGVINFAKALNVVLEKNKDVKVIIVGKDTKRNSKNISTKKYMLNIIDSKFHYRIKFVGQIDNSQINHFLNKAKLAVFPSIFDNFPYAVLEAMSAGKHIICSDNMGVLDLIKNNKYNFIFKHYSYKDLAQKMCDFYDLKTPFLNNMNIEKVNNLCNQKHICEKMKSYYKIAINEYKKTDEQINLYSKILKKGGINDKILKIKNIKSNLANDVKKVITQNNCYIIKKYNYDYDFSLSNDLYTIYSKKNFNVVRPINSELIIFDGYNYNIFNYIPHTNKTVSNDFLIEMIKCDRKVNMRANLNDKCDKYYNYLLKLKSYKLEEEEFVIKMYKNLRSYTLFNDTYLNHGDLSKSNILHYNNNYYLIDFDEVTISTELYDFANIVVKHKVKNNKFQLEEIKYIISLLSNKYTFNDYIVSIKYYLCKILLEKFYLFEREVINLMDDVQIKDDYRKYILLLKEIDKMENF